MFWIKIRSKPLSFLGKISYEMYLTHIILLDAYFTHINLKGSYSVYIFVILTVLISIIIDKLDKLIFSINFEMTPKK